MYKYTDGGRAEAGINDKNDCAVRAYSIFKQVPYAEAHALFAAEGRRNGRGTQNAVITKLLGASEAHTTQMTLNQLRYTYPNHRVYALKRGHAFALVGGVLYDSWKVGGKSRVFKYWVAPMNGSETVTETPQTTDTPQAEPQAPQMSPAEKKERAYAIYKWLSYGGMTKYGIAKQIASELNISIANANYYVTRVFK